MKRVLIFAPCDRYAAEPAFRIRLLSLVAEMKRRGFDWQIHARPKSIRGRIRLAQHAECFDAVILHRKWLDPYEARLLRRSLAPPRPIIMDIDDATMHHETPLGRIARWRLNRRFAATAAILDGVAAGNEYLAALLLARNAGITACIIPSTVDPERYRVKTHAQTEKPRLVWVGSASTMKYLLQAMPALGEAAKRVAGLSLLVISDRPPENPTLPIDFRPWSLEVEAAAISEGDIGIAPTPLDRWTLGKCGYKIVQYMAAGLPVIASPVGMNVNLVRGNGAACGLLPAEFSQWPAAMEMLARDVALRSGMGAIGRERVQREYSITHAADLWEKMLESRFSPAPPTR